MQLVSAVKKETQEEAASFAPQINKKSIRLAAAKREGKIEDHLLK